MVLKILTYLKFQYIQFCLKPKNGYIEYIIKNPPH